MKWISVEERLPKIPKGKHAISVIVAEFDPCYEELNPGCGYDVHSCMFGKYKKNELFPEECKENQFLCLCYGNNSSFWVPVADIVTHWMYFPKPPKYKKEK